MKKAIFAFRLLKFDTKLDARFVLFLVIILVAQRAFYLWNLLWDLKATNLCKYMHNLYASL